MRRRRAISITAVVVAALLFARCSVDRSPPFPGILLVTIDTLRSDRIHCYGNDEIPTPAIDSLAAEGVLFENAISPIPVTLPSHTSILTGLYPNQHGVRDNGVYRVPEKLDTAAEIFRRNGWETAAFVSAHVLSRIYRTDQGFDHFDDEMVEPLIEKNPIRGNRRFPEHTRRWLEKWTEPYQRRAETTVTRAIDWFVSRDRRKPFFCWVHLFDPHLAYSPPEPWRSVHRSGYDGEVDGTGESFLKIAKETGGKIPIRHVRRMIELYDGEVSYVDFWLGKLLDAIPDSTLVVFAADHGEAFGEHGLFFEHQTSIFQETVRVPLIIKGPGVGPGGTRRTDLVSLVDILPTLLESAGFPRPRGLAGVPLLDGPIERPNGVYSETHASITAVPARYGYKSVRTSDWVQIYRIAKPGTVIETFLHYTPDDPLEGDNLFAAEPARSKEMDQKFEALLRLGREDDGNPTAYWSLDEGEDRRKSLKALGYLGD